MDRHFAAAFEADLTPNWVLSDSFGSKFNVTYNMDTANPRIVHGWTDLEKSYLSQIWDAHVQFRYIGNSEFEITVFVGECSPENMHAFLRRANRVPDGSFFSVTLTKSQAQRSHLVFLIF